MKRTPETKKKTEVDMISKPIINMQKFLVATMTENNHIDRKESSVGAEWW